MKVTFQYGIGSFQNTTANAVFTPTKNKNGSIMRRWVKPKETAQNISMGLIGKNLAVIFASTSAGFKGNLKTLADYLNSHTDPNIQFDKKQNKYSLFTKMMFAFKEDQGVVIDLSTITLNDIQTLFSDLDNVYAAITAGYLPSIPSASTLDKAI